MGFAFCRFREQTGCKELGSQEWHISLNESNVILNIPSMWKHYMQEHLVQPTNEEREIVLSANPKNVSGTFIGTRGLQSFREVKILYVEKLESGGYTHQIGTSPDTEFINKLEEIIQGIEPLQTKGIDSKPGYR
jgi:hypothetical protein